MVVDEKLAIQISMTTAQTPPAPGDNVTKPPALPCFVKILIERKIIASGLPTVKLCALV